MARRARRHQLLDVAAGILADGESVTMERVADVAGVSKSLPYAHFDNAEHLLVSLYRRSSVALGESVWQALGAARPEDDLVETWIHAHFHCGEVQGAVFAALIRPGSPIPAKADRDSDGQLFVAQILHRYFGIDRDHARVVSGVVLGGFLGASNTWLTDRGDRAVVEGALASMVRGILHDAPPCPAPGHVHTRLEQAAP